MMELDDLTRIETDETYQDPAEWFVILRAPEPYGAPVVVGQPIRGRDRAEAMLTRHRATGASYALFSVDREGSSSHTSTSDVLPDRRSDVSEQRK